MNFEDHLDDTNRRGERQTVVDKSLYQTSKTSNFTHLWDQSVQVALLTQSVQAVQALLEGQFFLGVLPSQGDQEVLVCHGTLLHAQAVSQPGDKLTLL